MNELIKIRKSDGGRDVVSARELYLFLSIDDGSHFARWATSNIVEMFIENIDFQSLRQGGENGGRPGVDYAITIDAAKEISMMSRCEKGKQARRYFIECEKRLKSQHAIPQTYADALRLASDQARQIEIQEGKMKELEPKVLFADSVATSDKSILITELAKIITQNGIEIGQNRLFIWLRANNYLCKKGESYNQPTQESMNMGLFEIKKTSITKPNGTVLVTTTPKVTGKGQIYFVNKFLHSKVPQL